MIHVAKKKKLLELFEGNGFALLEKGQRNFLFQLAIQSTETQSARSSTQAIA